MLRTNSSNDEEEHESIGNPITRQRSGKHPTSFRRRKRVFLKRPITSAKTTLDHIFFLRLTLFFARQIKFAVKSWMIFFPLCLHPSREETRSWCFVVCRKQWWLSFGSFCSRNRVLQGALGFIRQTDWTNFQSEHSRSDVDAQRVSSPDDGNQLWTHRHHRQHCRSVRLQHCRSVRLRSRFVLCSTHDHQECSWHTHTHSTSVCRLWRERSQSTVHPSFLLQPPVTEWAQLAISFVV